MSPEGYTEDHLVEQPAIQLFAELAWTTVSALEEVFGSAEPSPVPFYGVLLSSAVICCRYDDDRFPFSI